MRKLCMTAAVIAAAAISGVVLAQPTAPFTGPNFMVGGRDAAYWAGRAGRPDPDSDPQKPFKIAGNVYYVGARNIASILIVTPKGDILIDTGTTKMGSVVLPNVAALGFKPSDIKYLLISHAHFDHVQTVELHRRLLGAAMMALDKEVPALSTGHDLSSLESEGFEPIHVDTVLHDGDEFALGGEKVKIIWAPGHTPGNADYLITTTENGKPVTIMFGGMPTPIAGNPKFNTRPEDAFNAFKALRAINPDIQVIGHPEDLFKGKLDALWVGSKPSPLALAPGAWAKTVDDGEARYRAALAASMSTAPAAPAAR